VMCSNNYDSGKYESCGKDHPCRVVILNKLYLTVHMRRIVSFALIYAEERCSFERSVLRAAVKL
jgi:hypothetical protein